MKNEARAVRNLSRSVHSGATGLPASASKYAVGWLNRIRFFLRRPINSEKVPLWNGWLNCAFFASWVNSGNKCRKFGRSALLLLNVATCNKRLLIWRSDRPNACGYKRTTSTIKNLNLPCNYKYSQLGIQNQDEFYGNWHDSNQRTSRHKHKLHRRQCVFKLVPQGQPASLSEWHGLQSASPRQVPISIQRKAHKVPTKCLTSVT